VTKNGMIQRRRLTAALMGLAPLAAAGRLRAEEVVRLIVPFAAGSYTDTVARLVSPGLSQQLGKTVIVENRGGANGIIGAEYVARRVPSDGLTLLVGGASVNTINPSVYKSLPYDPERDLLPVARIGVLPFLLLVNAALPVRSVAELIQYAKANPGKLAYGTPNAATLVGSETFKRSASIDLLSVSYTSSPQAMNDLASNQIQVLIADQATATTLLQAGKVRLLAVTMKDRSSALPDTPTIADTLPGFDLSAWTGLLAPGWASPEAVRPVYEALRASLADADLQARFKAIGFDIDLMAPDAFGPYIRSEIAKWRGVARDAGIQPQ
jgi:tripartite-type tricarboxylate transporter receptor subunit TctC